MPEKALIWDLTGTEGCGGGKVVPWLSAIDLGYKSIYIGGRSTSVELRGAHEAGGAPSFLVAASRNSRLPLQVSWFAFDPRKIIAKVSFRLVFLFSKTLK